jgi:hypothetical protein
MGTERYMQTSTSFRRQEECACGGVIVNRFDSAIAFDVAQHNASITHLIWRRGREAPTVDKEPGDLSRETTDASALPVTPYSFEWCVREGVYRGICECRDCLERFPPEPPLQGR